MGSSDTASVVRRPTLAAVAARAGVSVSTASLAFSGAGPVAPDTRDRVRQAAAELQYAGPDPRGRSLRSGRSGIVGVVLQERVLEAFRDPINIAVLDGIAQEVSPQGRALLLLADMGEGAHAIRTTVMDAIVLVACSPAIARTIEQARRRDVPIVAIGGPVVPGVLSVSIDDRAATAQLARHLADLGHRDVAMVTLPLDLARTRGPLTADRIAASTTVVADERILGVRDVFPDAGGVVAAGSYVDEGVIAGHALLADPTRRPTAVVAQSDLLAAGVIRAAQELGLRVPEDLSVVGFDGVRVDDAVPHDLATMVQPAAEEGRAAGRAVLALLDGDEQDPQDVAFTCTFHRGATTAPPAQRR